MKKTLTQNISRYDSKMLLKLDFRTLKVILISALAGFILWLILNIWLILIYSMGLSIIAALMLMLLQLAEKDGMSLIRKLSLMLAPPVRRQYEHTTDRPEDRLIIEKKEERKEVT